MNTILVEVSVGELLDKISILEIKKEKIKDSEKLKFINDEYEVLKDQLDKNVKSDKKLEEFFNNLKKTNLKLWSIEDDKRMCEKNSDFGEKFIKLSREIHFLNDNRSKVKLEINKYTGSQIREIKQYTNY
jgi:adenine C2-methylase RlmN of 23S rRNA A2503 and tRNA A37